MADRPLAERFAKYFTASGVTGAASRACFAVVTPGFESVVARELAALGIVPRAPEAGGVSFPADDATLFAANLHLRAASRVLVRVATFTAKSFAELERRAKTVPWKSYVRPDGAAAFRVTCRKSRLYHSGAVAERLAKSLAAQMPQLPLARIGTSRVADDEADESPDATDAVIPPQLFVVRFEHDTCTISADASGELLHRRGYRLATAKAPIRETIAAGCLLALGYDGTGPLVDPMCGSGTFPIEAALIARNIAPGHGRSFACERWPQFDVAAAKRVRTRATAMARPAAAAPIHASDRDAGAVEATIANAARAGVGADVVVNRCSLSATDVPGAVGVVIANPPYGARVGERTALRNLYAQFGKVTREKFPGWRIALVLAEQSLEAQTKLPLKTVVKFSNGGIRVRLVATEAAP